VRFSAGSQREVDRWLATLQKQSATPGAGFLAVSQGGGRVRGAYSRRYYCCVMGDELHGFKRPRDGLEGTPSERVWKLDGAVVRGLQAVATTQERRRSAEVHFGFEIEDSRSGSTWHFSCDSYVEERAWLEKLHNRPKAGALLALPAPEEAAEPSKDEGSVGGLAAGPQTGEATAEDLAAEGESSTAADEGDGHSSSETEESSEEEDGPEGLLRYLDRRLSERIERWERAMVAAETDCRALLKFFGLQVPQHQQLGAAVTRLLEAMSEFVRHTRGAWADLDRHAQAQELRSRAQKRAQKQMQQQPRRSLDGSQCQPGHGTLGELRQRFQRMRQEQQEKEREKEVALQQPLEDLPRQVSPDIEAELQLQLQQLEEQERLQQQGELPPREECARPVSLDIEAELRQQLRQLDEQEAAQPEVATEECPLEQPGPGQPRPCSEELLEQPEQQGQPQQPAAAAAAAAASRASIGTSRDGTQGIGAGAAEGRLAHYEGAGAPLQAGRDPHRPGGGRR